MRRALLAAGLTLAAAAASVAPEAAPALYAQESPRLASMEIEIWPEFDRRAAVLVILRGRLADEVPLPATVALRIPASAGGPAAVASASSEGADLFTRDYELADADGSILLTLTTPDPLFQVEFYDPLRIDVTSRSYAYVWPGDLAVNQLSVVVQEPIGATALSTEPDLEDRTVGADQLIYRSAEMGPFEFGKALTVNVSYAKSDPHTTLEIINPGQAESDGGIPPWAIFAAVIAALAGVAGAVILWRRQTGAAAAPVGPTRAARRRSRRASPPGGSPSAPTSCPQCGNQLLPGHRFCPLCGTAAREE